MGKSIKWKNTIFYGASEQMAPEVAILGILEILGKYGYKMSLHFPWLCPLNIGCWIKWAGMVWYNVDMFCPNEWL